jgi:hypothetical protein
VAGNSAASLSLVDGGEFAVGIHSILHGCQSFIGNGGVSDEDDIDIFLSLGRASNMVNTQFVCDVLYDMSSEKKTWLSKKLDIIACADGPMTDKEQEYVDSITFIMQNKVPSEIIKALFK